jgi:hypothetical protein
MSDPKPTRTQGDLAEMLELVLDKGVVINADIAVSIGDTELLSVELRAAIASFETAAQYGLEFPSGTQTERIEAVADGDVSMGDTPQRAESQPASESIPDRESEPPATNRTEGE